MYEESVPEHPSVYAVLSSRVLSRGSGLRIRIEGYNFHDYRNLTT